MSQRLHFVIKCVCLLAVLSTRSALANKPLPATEFSVDEAQLLLYLLPVAHDIRTQGFDTEAAFDPGGSDKRQMTFMVQVTGRDTTGSVLVGHFGVDRVSGEITNLTLGVKVTSKEIEGVRRILMRAK